MTLIFVQSKIGEGGDLYLTGVNLPHPIISRKDGFCDIGAAVQTAEACKGQKCAKKWSAERPLKKNIQTYHRGGLFPFTIPPMTLSFPLPLTAFIFKSNSAPIP